MLSGDGIVLANLEAASGALNATQGKLSVYSEVLVRDLCSYLLSCFSCGDKLPARSLYHTPIGYSQGNMSHLENEKQKLVARIKRIRGQVDSIERSLTAGDDCADVLMLLANVRGGINSLMAEVLEDHIRLHLLSSEMTSARPVELAEDLIDLVRAYLK